ncbi:type 2 lanthipeptide synthetase LanM family protein [[Phormidium] sp. ETS-05]|uniref:type 2 lanthipeptide synthetase LanM family protein n=1 Tax=[Phormidium] sp. ETS-05 TaxID=222819 RepID=UPI0018EECCFE|nr:type 2 lanthipeptide synthetase LanM family protein [[Phormidium] sp. ETS-05]
MRWRLKRLNATTKQTKSQEEKYQKMAINNQEIEEAMMLQAMALHERIAAGVETNGEFDAKKAQQRLKKWRCAKIAQDGATTQAPFDDQEWWWTFLAWNNLTEAEFLYLLGESAESLHQRCEATPDWLLDLSEALAQTPELDSREILTTDSSGFLGAVEPFIALGKARLRRGIEALMAQSSKEQMLPFNPDTVETILLGSLPGQLLQILSRTMALELNVARLQGRLPDSTPEERFASFVQHLRQRHVQIALWQEYPVLARQVVTCVQHHVAASLEFLDRLCADWEDIRARFSVDKEPGVLVRFDDSAGDRHRGGRCVSIAQFSSGLNLVYKPKSLAVDVHFQELIGWVNQQGCIPPLATLKIIVGTPRRELLAHRGGYGWVEFVSASECTSFEGIQKFYQRLGGYLALLYALEATDFHYENLIAAGEHPILIDLESLFHPRLPADSLNPFRTEIALENSVLRVGLLPQRLWAAGEYRGIDLSGMGAGAGQLVPGKQPYWEDVGTDRMRVELKAMELQSAQNRPSLNGVAANPLDFTSEIIAGFTAIYQLLQQHREQLLSDSGIVAKFALDEVRVIVRPTRTYALLRHSSTHPDVVRNGLESDRLFHKLWVDVQERPETAKIIPAELRDLWLGDIPMFVTRANSRDLWTSDNHQIPDFAAESGMERVQRRLQEFDETDLERQIWWIRAALATVAMEGDQIRWPTYPLPEPQPLPNSEELLAAACAVADRLEFLAVRDSSSISWVGLIAAGKGCWSLAPLGLNLYDGVPGISLFLAYLGEITGAERYRALSRAAADTVLAQIAHSKLHYSRRSRQSNIDSIGGFVGWGGAIYALTHLAALWQQPQLLETAVELAELLRPEIALDEHLDIFYGAAGCICSLLALHRCHPESRILEIVRACADRLLERALAMDVGIGWVSKGVWHQPLSGFSHGAAGIALALLQASAATGDDRFRTAAVQAIAYERSLFCPTVNNWRDLHSESGSIFAATWAQGAPGIGLARLQSLPYFDDADIRQEINTAIAITIESGFGLNHSLGSGDFGSLELLLQAGMVFQDSALMSGVRAKAALILASIRSNGWICGTPFGVQTPGLINGLAGIGYGCLRLVAPERVPNVLVLEPPHLPQSSSLSF